MGIFEMQEMTHKHTRELDIFCNEHHDKCTLCGKSFSNGDTTHLGYLKNNLPAYLCDACSHQLRETVARYSWTKRAYETPEQADLLWRYMDLSKFISLISKKELYFAAATSFSDPFEGAKGIAERKDKWDNFYLDFFKKALLTVPGENPSRFTNEELETESQRLLEELHSGGTTSRESTFISCWHMSKFESEAMWKLYSRDTSNAVAIQTTYQRLYEALGRSPYIAIGKVKYIDFSKKFASVNDAFWYKQESFDYEKEVRAIVQDYEKAGASGISVPVDVDLLIENLYVSPYASTWFYDVVQSVLEKYSLEKSILRSQMRAIPFY